MGDPWKNHLFLCKKKRKRKTKDLFKVSAILGSSVNIPWMTVSSGRHHRGNFHGWRITGTQKRLVEWMNVSLFQNVKAPRFTEFLSAWVFTIWPTTPGGDDLGYAINHYTVKGRRSWFGKWTRQNSCPRLAEWMKGPTPQVREDWISLLLVTMGNMGGMPDACWVPHPRSPGIMRHSRIMPVSQWPPSRGTTVGKSFIYRR